MKSRGAIVAVALVLILVVAAGLFLRTLGHRPLGNDVAIYYAQPGATALGTWRVSLSPNARDLTSVAFYAAAQAVAGPPPDVSAVRFPSGTITRSVHVANATATVDLAGTIANDASGSFAESAEFKALVWTLTSLAGVTSVQIVINGARVATLPGGHLELDEPLTRQSW